MAIAELIATLAAALFAGAALYVNLVEHPARMTLGPAAALAEFAPSYQRGTNMQATLAVAGCVAGVVAWVLGAPRGWLVGACLLGAVVPFTLIVIFPTNRALLAKPGDSEASRLLARWNRLHAVRTALSLAALVAFLLMR
jgi:hypothetical protein